MADAPRKINVILIYWMLDSSCLGLFRVESAGFKVALGWKWSKVSGNPVCYSLLVIFVTDIAYMYCPKHNSKHIAICSIDVIVDDFDRFDLFFCFIFEIDKFAKSSILFCYIGTKTRIC